VKLKDMSAEQSRVTLYSAEYCQYGRYSSYVRLLDYVKNCRKVDASRGLTPWVERRRKLFSVWQQLNEWRLRPIFARRERQCVHYLYSGKTLFRGHQWKGRHGLVMTCHRPPSLLESFGPVRGARSMQAMRTADRVILLAEASRSGFEPYCKPGAIRAIPLGVDVHFFQPGAGPRPGRPLILTVGNWLRDYDHWVETVKVLAAKNKDVSFAVVGSDQTVARLRGALNRELANRVELLSHLTDEQLRETYQRATLLFLPLTDTAANNALLESLACGLPIVATDLPATHEYAGDAGIFFPPKAADECASVLAGLLADEQRLAALSRTSRERAVNQFAWEIIAKRHEDLYAEVLADAR
jgi:glycosyltransferase involved in cell wall biosynthesis